MPRLLNGYCLYLCIGPIALAPCFIVLCQMISRPLPKDTRLSQVTTNCRQWKPNFMGDRVAERKLALPRVPPMTLAMAWPQSPGIMTNKQNRAPSFSVLGSLSFRHGGKIQAIAFSPNGALIA